MLYTFSTFVACVVRVCVCRATQQLKHQTAVVLSVQTLKNNILESIYLCFTIIFSVHRNIISHFEERPTQRHPQFRDFSEIRVSVSHQGSFHVTVCWCSVADHLQVFADSKRKRPAVLTLVLTEGNNRISVRTAKFALLRHFLFSFSCLSPSSPAPHAAR